LDPVALVYVMFSMLLLGGGVVVTALYYKRNFFKKKIKCYFYTRENAVEEQLLKPNSDNQFEWNGGNYMFVRDAVKLGKTVIGEGVPTLTFIEDNPYPILFVQNFAADIGEITARQIAADFDDKMARELGAVTTIEEDSEDLKQLKTYIVTIGLLLAMIMLIGFWVIGS